MHLENEALKITVWFPNNCMKLNEKKCHLMIIGAKGRNETTIKIDEACVKESKEENLLCVTFYQSFSSKQHIKALCKKRLAKNAMLLLEYRDTVAGGDTWTQKNCSG